MKKILSFVLVLMLGISCLSLAAAEEPTTITLWHRWGGANEKTLSQCVEAFMADNPDIKVDIIAKPGVYFDLLQSMIADAAAGNEKPDVFVGSYNCSTTSRGAPPHHCGRAGPLQGSRCGAVQPLHA